MAKKNEYEPIASQAALRAAVNMGPLQTQKDNSLTGQNTQNAINALSKSYGVTPNPVTPSQGGAMVQNSNGVSAQGGNTMTQQMPDNASWTRGAAQKAGINDVGWNAQTGMVTFGGKDYLKPDYISDEGKSYSSNQNIFKALNQYYKDTGNPIQEAYDYVGTTLGVPGAVTWSDGNLMIGGQIVPTVYVDDNGTAYAHQSDIDNAVAAYKESAGITGNQDIYNNWQKNYQNNIKKALRQVTDRDEWSYDPENDAAYRAYRDQYAREGNRAYQDAYAQMAANTSGYGSSAAMNAAGQQMNYYMQQLNDRVPELMANDYTRYLGEQELRRQALDSIMGVADNDYKKAYQANRDAIADVTAANEQSYKRAIDARDYNRDVLESDRVYPYQERLLQQQVAQGDVDTENYRTNADLATEAARLQNESARLANWQMQAQNALTRLGYSGNVDAPIDAQAAADLGIGAREDGSYPTFRDIIISMAQTEAIPENIMWELVTQPQTLWTYQLNNGLLGI